MCEEKYCIMEDNKVFIIIFNVEVKKKHLKYNRLSKEKQNCHKYKNYIYKNISLLLYYAKKIVTIKFSIIYKYK